MAHFCARVHHFARWVAEVNHTYLHQAEAVLLRRYLGGVSRVSLSLGHALRSGRASQSAVACSYGRPDGGNTLRPSPLFHLHHDSGYIPVANQTRLNALTEDLHVVRDGSPCHKQNSVALDLQNHRGPETQLRYGTHALTPACFPSTNSTIPHRLDRFRTRWYANIVESTDNIDQLGRVTLESDRKYSGPPLASQGTLG